MTEQEYKEACFVVFATKGRLPPIHWSDASLRDAVDDYSRRMWSNEEATYTVNQDKFEQLWRQRCIDLLNRNHPGIRPLRTERS